MKAKKILLSVLSIFCFGFSALTITSCDLFTTDSSNDVSGGNDSTPSDTSTEEQPHVHEWDDGVETTKATCTTEGQITYTCSGCDEVKFETIASKGHTEVVDAAVEATCTATGLTEGKHCSVCNEVLIAQEVVPTNHNYDNYVCIDCGYNYYTEGLEFTLSSDGESYSVTGYKGTATEVVIPSIYDNKPVAKIAAEAFKGCGSIKSIFIADSVTSIGGAAFYECTSLTSIIIPESVASIGQNTFLWCCSLTNVTIPNSVTTIGKSAFELCSSLVSITIPDSVTSIGDRAFFNCYSLENIIVDVNNEHYDSRNNCNAIIETDTNTLIVGCINTIIPDDVEIIGENAFRKITSLKNITIPDSVTYIGDLAFFDCDSLTSVIIPNAVTSIDYGAFMNCSNLECITIPNSVTYIGRNAFEECYSLTTVYYTGTEEQWSKFNIFTSGNDCLTNANIICTGVEDVLPSTEGLEFTLSEDGESYSVTGIGTATDTDIVIPSTYNGKPVTSIGESAFQSCGELTSITIPNSVTSINDYAFYYCTSLTSIPIPDSVATIGGAAFAFCASLTSITIPNSVTSIGEGAFTGCMLLENISVDVNNKFYDSRNDCNALIETSTNTLLNGCKNTIIPDGVISISTLSFHWCSSLEAITIPNSVTSIGFGAFWCCSSLKSIVIPDSVKYIGENAFHQCDSLTTVYYTGAEEQWNAITIGDSNEKLTNADIHYDYVPEE